MPWVPARAEVFTVTVSERGHQTLVRCLLRPSTQGLLTKLREEPSIVSLKVRPAYCGLPFFVLTASIASKEHSLHATKVVVRKKLGLGHDAPIELAQLRDGKKIDLEDGVFVHLSQRNSQSQPPEDDDFEAFRALANSSLHATVAVTIPPSGSSAVRDCIHFPCS